MTERRIEYLPLSTLVPAHRNPKAHALDDLRESVDRFGYVEPVVLDERTQRLVAGHGRIQALTAMRAQRKEPPDGVRVGESGEWLMPVIRGWGSKSEREAEAFLVASNQLTTAGGWDKMNLLTLLEELDRESTLVGTGFTPPDLDKLLAELATPLEINDQEEPDADDAHPEPSAEPWVQPGDLFELGQHRILCGDSTKSEDLERLMGTELVDMCFTDPPWNAAIGEEGSTRESRVRAGFKTTAHQPISNDNLGENFPGFCSAFCGEMANVMKEGAPIYLVMSPAELGTIDAALKGAGFHWSSTIIWAKNALVPSRRDYQPQYEPIWYGWKEGSPRLVELKDRTQSDIWHFDRPRKSVEHPTMKPVALVERAVLNSSRRSSIILEPFSGSGTTLMAAERTGRKCRAIEIAPAYTQVAIERWQKFTGRKARKL
jgi:DNA modification methylase